MRAGSLIAGAEGTVALVIKKKKKSLLLYSVSVLTACMSVCHVHVLRAEVSIRFTGTGVASL